MCVTGHISDVGVAIPLSRSAPCWKTLIPTVSDTHDPRPTSLLCVAVHGQTDLTRACPWPTFLDSFALVSSRVSVDRPDLCP